MEDQTPGRREPLCRASQLRTQSVLADEAENQEEHRVRGQAKAVLEESALDPALLFQPGNWQINQLCVRPDAIVGEDGLAPPFALNDRGVTASVALLFREFQAAIQVAPRAIRMIARIEFQTVIEDRRGRSLGGQVRPDQPAFLHSDKGPVALSLHEPRRLLQHRPGKDRRFRPKPFSDSFGGHLPEPPAHLEGQIVQELHRPTAGGGGAAGSA